MELLLNKCLGEDVDTLFSKWTKLQINDLVIYQLSEEMHMDLDVFGLLSRHWLSAKLEITFIVTSIDNHMMQLDVELNEEVLK